MKKHIFNEPKAENPYPPLGKYGMMRRTYLKEHQKAFYIQLQARGELWQHLNEVDQQAQSMVDAIVTRMAEIDGVTEELKATDQMQWIGLMNNYRHCAEKIVLRDVVDSKKRLLQLCESAGIFE